MLRHATMFWAIFGLCCLDSLDSDSWWWAHPEEAWFKNENQSKPSRSRYSRYSRTEEHRLSKKPSKQDDALFCFVLFCVSFSDVTCNRPPNDVLGLSFGGDAFPRRGQTTRVWKQSWTLSDVWCLQAYQQYNIIIYIDIHNISTCSTEFEAWMVLNGPPEPLIHLDTAGHQDIVTKEAYMIYDAASSHTKPPDIRSRSFPNAVLLLHVCANNLHQFLHISMFAAIACVLFLNISQLVSGSKI